MATTFTLNGKSQTVDVSPEMPLLWVLRDTLNMTGTKFGCGMALCGASAPVLPRSPASPERKSPPLKACPRMAPTPSSKPGSPKTSPSAATANPAKSCPPSLCYPKSPIRPTPKSTTSCPATSAAAAPINASAKPSIVLRGNLPANLNPRNFGVRRSCRRFSDVNPYDQQRLEATHDYCSRFKSP